MTCQVVEDGEEVEEMQEIELSSDEEQVRCWGQDRKYGGAGSKGCLP